MLTLTSSFYAPNVWGDEPGPIAEVESQNQIVSLPSQNEGESINHQTVVAASYQYSGQPRRFNHSHAGQLQQPDIAERPEAPASAPNWPPNGDTFLQPRGNGEPIYSPIFPGEDTLGLPAPDHNAGFGHPSFNGQLVHLAEPIVLSPPVAEPIVLAPVGCVSCGQSNNCSCSNGHRRTRVGRFIQNAFNGICCPDPCYKSEWTMLANASLFTNAARPQTRQRYRWDYFDRFQFQDRAEYLWARSSSNGGVGPAIERSINYHQLSMYVETGSEKFSFFVNTPYRSIYLDSGGHNAGFADLTTGTKTLLHDTELIQISFQMATHIPSANPQKGLGRGHVVLEPSLIMGLQLSCRSFLQAQIAEWIPIGGEPDYAGALLKYSTSYNRILMGQVNDTSLTGTFEMSGISFQDGAFTEFGTNAQRRASNETFTSLGSGLRINICNKVNIGFGALFNVTENSFADTAYRTEIQFRH